MKFTLATCVRNEGPYLLEWVAHYKLLGFDRIVIYSNDNTDGSDELLEQMQKEGLIIWRPRTLSEGESPQLSAFKAYSHELFSNPDEQGGYLAWLDCDEFLVLKKHSSIQDLLGFYDFPDGLYLNWKHFGSSAALNYKPELTLLRFLECDSTTHHNKLGKCISRIVPGLFASIINHRPIPLKRNNWGRIIYAADQTNDIPVSKDIIYGANPKKNILAPIYHDICQLNHYAVRSEEEYSWKSARGNGWRPVDNKSHFLDSYFREHDLNNEQDSFAAEKYSDAIKNYIAKLPIDLRNLEKRVVERIVKNCRTMLNDNLPANQPEQQNLLKTYSIDKLAKKLFILRCHNFGEAENFLLNTVAPYFGKDNILIVADERSQNVYVNEWKKASFTNEKLRSMGIFDHPNCGWLCGDYFFYVAYDQCPDYDYYWLCEPDVYFSFDSIEDFFKNFDDNSADLLAPKFRKRDNSWAWTKKAEIISENVYGCLFPITRISQKAVKHLCDERKKLTSLFESNELKPEKWPNDESFVSTVLHRDGFVCQNLNSISTFFSSDFNFGSSFILWNTVVDKPSLNKVLHPVLRDAEFQRKVSKSLKKMKSVKQIDNYLGNKIFPNATADVSFEVARNAVNIIYNTLNVIYEEIKSTLLKSHPNLSNDKMQQFDTIFQQMQLVTNESQNIIIIHPLKIAFQNVPKVGTTSLFNWIYELIYKEKYNNRKKNIHDWFKSQNNNIIENKSLKYFKQPEGYFVFCVLRDPVKRLLSAYSNRVSYYKELNLSRINNGKVESDLAGNPSLNYFISNLESYQSRSESIFHHTRPLIDFIGENISIYHRIFDLSELSELRQTLIKHWCTHHLITKDQEIPELPRLQTQGKKFSLGDLTASSFEKCLELYNCDYKTFPMLDINKIREEWQSQNSNPETYSNEIINKAEAKIKPAPNVVEIRKLFKKFFSVNKGEVEAISGVVLLKLNVENTYKLIAKDIRGEWQLQWKLSSPKYAQQHPDNPHAISARFKTQKLQIDSQHPIKIFIEDSLKKRHLLFVISAESLDSNVNIL